MGSDFLTTTWTYNWKRLFLSWRAINFFSWSHIVRGLGEAVILFFGPRRKWWPSLWPITVALPNPKERDPHPFNGTPALIAWHCPSTFYRSSVLVFFFFWLLHCYVGVWNIFYAFFFRGKCGDVREKENEWKMSYIVNNGIAWDPKWRRFFFLGYMRR